MAKTWQVVLATVAIFVAGLVTGAAFTLGAVRWVARHPRVNPAQMFAYAQARPAGAAGPAAYAQLHKPARPHGRAARKDPARRAAHGGPARQGAARGAAQLG